MGLLSMTARVHLGFAQDLDGNRYRIHPTPLLEIVKLVSPSKLANTGTKPSTTTEHSVMSSWPRPTVKGPFPEGPLGGDHDTDTVSATLVPHLESGPASTPSRCCVPSQRGSLPSQQPRPTFKCTVIMQLQAYSECAMACTGPPNFQVVRVSFPSGAYNMRAEPTYPVIRA
jgi:hypothetical protein